MFASYGDIRFTDVRGFGTNGHAAAEMTWSAVIRNEQAGGQPRPNTVTHTMALICNLANGKFTRVAFYWDNYTSLVQSGALKPLPTATPSS